MKVLILFFSMLTAISVIAQIKTSENRIEIQLKDGYENENVFEFGKNGFVLTSQSERYMLGQCELRFQRYSTDLTSVDEQIFQLKKGFIESKSFVEDNVLNKLIMNRLGQYSILQYDIRSGELSQMDGDFGHSFVPMFFEVANGTALIAGYYKRKWSFTFINLTSGQLNTSDLIIEGIKQKKTGAMNVQFIEQSKSFYVSICGYPPKKGIKWYLQQYDLTGSLLNTIELDEEIDKTLISTTVAALDKKDILISGTYTDLGGTSSTGLFMTTTVDGELQQPQYYNYIDIENFLSYLPERKQERIEKQKERKAENGKQLEFSYFMAIHDIIPCGEDFLFLGEAYYPTYRLESSTSTVNGKTTTTVKKVFDGYQYTHAHIAKFNKAGELLWSQCFEMYPKSQPFYVKRFISISGQTENSIKLVFADGNYIYGKEFDFNGVLISDKTSSKINGSMENDKEQYGGSSEVLYWYDNYFLSYGIQRIKNTKDNDAQRKRNVLFVNKIKFE
jgi:hypothetical protein